MSLGEFVKRFLAILLILSLWVGAWVARSTLLLGFAAAMIAVGISIPAAWLERHGWRRAWAIPAAIMGVGLVTILLLLLVVPRLTIELVNLLRSTPDAIRSLVELYERIRQQRTFLAAALPPVPAAIEAVNITPEQAQAILNQLIDTSLAIAPSVLGGVSQVAAVVINLIFVLFIAIFFLIDPQSYVKGSLYLLPQRHHARAIAIWNMLYQTITLWLSSLMLSITITVTLVWLILGLLLGMPNAVVVAVFAGLATFIPNIGAFLPLIPITIFTLANDPAQLIIMAPVYLAIQLLESNVITPSIVQAELSIPPGILMLFQLLITLAFGALGLLLAVPIFAVLMVLIREIYSYALLGLDHTVVTVTPDIEGHFQLTERAVHLGDAPNAAAAQSDTRSPQRATTTQPQTSPKQSTTTAKPSRQRRAKNRSR
ncbi:MAG: AI-2E family transporter [Caldilineaceae bacterium]